MRYPLGVLLVCALVRGVSAADPVALVLANAQSAPEIADPAASNSHEAVGEPAPEGELDAGDMSALGSRLTAIALAYESFRDAADLDADSRRLVAYTSPQGLIPDPADRAQTLDRVYRALALLDDTQALRYPEGESCARAHRLSLLRSSDGLFADPKTGELAPWLRAELKRAKANEAPGGLIAASAREWTTLGYLKTLAEARALSLQLGDRNILGAPRAAAFCRRAKVYEELAGAQAALRQDDPDLSEQMKSVVEVVEGNERGAGTVLLVEGKAVALVSGRFTENPYEAPVLLTRAGKHLSAGYLRRGPVFSLLSVQTSPDVVPLVFPEGVEQGGRVAYAVGHPIQGGPWSVTRGLAMPAGEVLITDAVLDGTQAGGPLFDRQGRLTGVIAGERAAYELGSIRKWLNSDNIEFPKVPATPERGTGSLLTVSAAFTAKENEGPIEASSAYVRIPKGVCVDPRGCNLSPSPSFSLDRSADSKPYTGPNLWEMLGRLKKLIQPVPRTESKLVDDHPSTARKSVTTPAQAAPEPPPDPLRPVSLTLNVSRTALAQGEELEAVATIAFQGKDGAVAGRGVSFTGVPAGKIECSAAKTDGSGVAKATCTALEGGRVTAFDSLEDEMRRRRGQKTAGRVRRKVAKGDKVGAMKERLLDQMSSLDNEADKHPDLGSAGSDTPGIDRPIPEADITELEVKGDRVTLGASIENLIKTIAIVVLERPCSDGGIPEATSSGDRYRCGSKSGGKPDFKNFSNSAEEPSSESEEVKGPDDDEVIDGVGLRNRTQSRPTNAPPGTVPLPQAGLPKGIHDRIKEGVNAGPKDWTGIDPDGNVITTKPDGKAENHGPWQDYAPNKPKGRNRERSPDRDGDNRN